MCHQLGKWIDRDLDLHTILVGQKVSGLEDKARKKDLLVNKLENKKTNFLYLE